MTSFKLVGLTGFSILVGSLQAVVEKTEADAWVERMANIFTKCWRAADSSDRYQATVIDPLPSDDPTVICKADHNPNRTTHLANSIKGECIRHLGDDLALYPQVTGGQPGSYGASDRHARAAEIAFYTLNHCLKQSGEKDDKGSAKIRCGQDLLIRLSAIKQQFTDDQLQNKDN